ncbi:hypothetical protein LOTGIDRAFT_176187 [Lottia gigantea]|uniref:Peptidase A2 domain-containing protein n=1 Tax=Lottia gigantea TaxID=225164 RepID=V3ZP62_LOTGI|nr:hypothetical protein LOTGIDRAFT_176187 [Lottia gigantea]ESO84290.1 hypothetical protein LOTGIDRAFT_176187 [Lottia gigantea]
MDNEARILFGIKHVNGSNVRNLDVFHPEIKVEMSILGRTVNFTLDTDASVKVIPEDLYFETFPDVSMEDIYAILRGYSGSIIPVVGGIFVDVVYSCKKYSDMRIIVVQRRYRKRQVHVDHLMETHEHKSSDEIDSIPNSDVDLDVKTKVEKVKMKFQ